MSEPATAQSPSRLVRSTKVQLGLLIGQYVAGMALNVVGLPEEATTTLQRVTGHALLGIHILIALGLFAGAFAVTFRLKGSPEPWRQAGHLGGAGIGTAFVFGLLALSPFAPELWSFLMSASFLVAAIGYSLLLARLTRS